MKTPSKIITANARKWVESLKKIEVVAVPNGNPMMNNSCHYNAVNQVKQRKAVAVVEVVTIVEGGSLVAHYINIDSNGDYYDITLGWSWSGCDYHLVRIISADSSELGDARRMLGNLKKKMYEMTPKYIRMLHKGDEWSVF